MRAHLARLGIAAALLAGAVAGCGSGHGGTAADRTGFHADIATWRLPLDGYVADQREQNNAQNAVYSSCMRARGIAAPRYDIDDYLPPTLNRVFRTLFDISTAQRYGYHPGPTRKDPLRVPRPKLRGAADVAAARACVRRINRRLHLNTELAAFVQTLAGRAEEQATKDRRVTAAVARWRGCMRPLRLSDLPDSPMSMPTPTQRKRFGMTGPVSPTRKNVPRDNSTVSPEEIREATFDARCQATSGYARAFYETEIADQQALIRRYQAELAVAQTAERRSATAMGAVLRAERSVG